jgi:DNA-binding transcriptional regulator YhcF (GntR family)
VNDENPIREQIFEYIIEFKRERDGLAPSVKEIAEACLLSESTVKYHLLKLETERRIRVWGRRGIEVIGGEWNYDG